MPKTKKKKATSYDEEDTERALSSPASNGQTVVIETRLAAAPRSGIAALLLSKKAMAVAALGTAGAATYFGVGWAEIPGLNNQIRDLEAEVGRLNGEVDRLETENERFSQLNNELNGTVQELQTTNQDLNETTIRLNALNQDLNATNTEFLGRIVNLEQENDEFEVLNADLNSTVIQLETELDQFQTVVGTLILENAELSDYTDSLTNVSDTLGDITEDQEATIAALEVALAELTRIDELNQELEVILGFLNDTTTDIGSSVDEVASYLEEQITQNRQTVLLTFESNARASIQTWDCDYRDIFRTFEWGDNFAEPIPANEQPEVIDYVYDRILQPNCMSREDFVLFLETTYPDFLTSQRLESGVTIYVEDGLDYYYGGVGVTPEEWATAGFECENLPNQFVYDDDVNVFNV